MLQKAYPHSLVTIHIIQTSGDRNPNPLSEIGGKNVFVKEIEVALSAHQIDIGVHSFKDITARPSSDLVYGRYVTQERATDAVIMVTNRCLKTEPTRLATGSMRRQALCRMLYPLVTCEPIRGNSDTRITLTKERGYDGLILSTAGLQRLGLDHQITHELDPMDFVPAPGQGIIALQHRANDTRIGDCLAAIGDNDTQKRGADYYRILEGIAFNCHCPLGVYYTPRREWRVFVEHMNHGHYMTYDSPEQVIHGLLTL